MPKLVQIIIGIFFIISNGRLVVKSALLFWAVEGIAATLRKTKVQIPSSAAKKKRTPDWVSVFFLLVKSARR